jgi:hypothetical protein
MTLNQIISEFNIRKLKAEEQVTFFDCGDNDLNDFILNEAFFYRQARLAETYIIERRTNKEVVGYFSLANDKISLSDFESKTEFNRFRKKRFVNEKRLKSYPAVKICRLGIATSMKGQHLGTFILDFIKSYFIEDNKTGCRFITVDAYEAAITFYMKNKFVVLKRIEPNSPTQLLYYDLDELIA